MVGVSVGSANNDAQVIRIEIVRGAKGPEAFMSRMANHAEANFFPGQLLDDGTNEIDGPAARCATPDMISFQLRRESLSQEGHLGLAEDSIKMCVEIVAGNVFDKDKSFLLDLFIFGQRLL